MKALTELSVGDKIASEVRYSGDVEIFTVERLTATTAVCRRATFQLNNGLMVGTGGGGGWNRRYGRIARSDDLVKSRIREAQNRVARIKVDEANLAAIEALLVSLAKATP